MKPPPILKKSFTLEQLAWRCVGKRDRECLFRLAKEASIIKQDFEAAMALREVQLANKPTRKARHG